MEKQRTTLYIPKDIHKDIKKYCIEANTNVSQLVTDLFKLVLRDDVDTK